MSGKITSILLRHPTLSELFCVVAAEAFSLSDVMWTAVLVSERLSDYSSSRQALTHSRGGKYTSFSSAANNRDRKALLCCSQATGATFVWIWLKLTPLCSFLAFASNFSCEADYTAKPLVYSEQDAMFWRLVPQWIYCIVLSLCQISESCTILYWKISVLVLIKLCHCPQLCLGKTAVSNIILSLELSLIESID